MIEQVLFYIFAAILLISSVKVLSVKNPVHAALFLILAFFTSSALWMLIEAEFLAIILVLVYVGVVMVLFLFVVMLLDINLEELRAEFVRFMPVGVVVGILIAVEFVLVIFKSDSAITNTEIKRHAADYSNTKDLGAAIYSDYLFAFEVAAAVLLVALVAAATLVLRKRSDGRSQKIGEHIKVQARDRVRLMDLKKGVKGD